MLKFCSSPVVGGKTAVGKLTNIHPILQQIIIYSYNELEFLICIQVSSAAGTRAVLECRVEASPRRYLFVMKSRSLFASRISVIAIAVK